MQSTMAEAQQPIGDRNSLNRGSHRVPIVVALLIFASLSIWQAIASKGFLEADGCTHYMYARWAFTYPVYFVDIWGRPFKTALYAPAAATIGLVGVRLTSLAVAITISFIAYSIAKGQKHRWPALALIFTLAQPLVFLHSFSELTELPFAMLLGLAFLAYQRSRWWLLAALAGLLPLSRPEGFGFLVLVCLLLALHRRWFAIPLLAIPVIGWQIAGAVMYHEPGNWWKWLPTHWPYAGDSLYPRGPIWHFAVLLPAVVGPMLFPFVLLGFWRGVRASLDARRDGVEAAQPAAQVGLRVVFLAIQKSHETRCDVLIVAIPFLIFAGHSILYALGKMASNGELRYMLIVAPFWALLAAKGWEWAWERFAGKTEITTADGDGDSCEPSYVAQTSAYSGWRSPFRYAAVAALVPVLANFGYKVLPLVQTEDWQTAARIAEWYKTSGVEKDYPYILAAHPGVAYALDRCPLDPKVVEWRRPFLIAPPDGTLLIWHEMYAQYNADSSRSIQLRELWESGEYVNPDFRVDPKLPAAEWNVIRSARKVDGSSRFSVWEPTGRAKYWPPPLPKWP